MNFFYDKHLPQLANKVPDFLTMTQLPESPTMAMHLKAWPIQDGHDAEREREMMEEAIKSERKQFVILAQGMFALRFTAEDEEDAKNVGRRALYTTGLEYHGSPGVYRVVDLNDDAPNSFSRFMKPPED